TRRHQLKYSLQKHTDEPDYPDLEHGIHPELSYVLPRQELVQSAYASNNWSGPTVIPNAYTTINLLIDGNAFTFHSGTYYTITLITSRNNQFTFTIKAS